jgi:hypothetical protein
MQALRRGAVYLLLILDLDTRWGERSASRPGRVLSPGKEPRYPLDRWASEMVWTQRLEEKAFACAGDRTTIVQSITSITKRLAGISAYTGTE